MARKKNDNNVGIRSGRLAPKGAVVGTLKQAQDGGVYPQGKKSQADKDINKYSQGNYQ